MDIWEYSKIFIFIMFVIPGFISLKVYEILQVSVSKESSKLIIDAVAYSCINYAVLFIPIFLVEKGAVYSSSPILYYIFYLFVFLIFPMILPVLLYLLRTSDLLKAKLPHPTGRAWDYYFRQSQDCWVIVTLNNGTKIGGAYRANAFASSNPEPEQLYLSEHWELNTDGGFERMRSDSLGILILSSDILSVEFFKMFPQQEEQND